MAGLFGGLQIALDLGYSVGFKKKAELRKKIVENGGIISYIVTKKCVELTASQCIKIEAFRPIFSVAATPGQNENKKKRFNSKATFNPRAVRTWTIDDPNQPWFDEDDYEIAKSAVFMGHNSHLRCQCTSVIELHAPSVSSSHVKPTETMMEDVCAGKTGFIRYRVVFQSGSSKDLEAGKQGQTELRYLPTSNQALAVYAMIYEDIQKKPEMKKCTTPVRGIGSHKLQKLMAQAADVQGGCSDEVKELVEHIWREATAEVTSLLGDISAIKIEQVEKAEAILVKVRDAIKSSAAEKTIEELISEFYTTLRHRAEKSTVDMQDRKRWLVKKQDMCQLIKDMISVSETTNYETRAYVEAKYAALRCRITNLTGIQKDEITDMVKSSLENAPQDFNIVNIYEVWRAVEDVDFRQDLDPKRLFFHSSKVENFVGILSRGLLLPKVVVDDFGGKRSDAGMLGSGIYFASAASTSVKYSSPSNTKGSRMLLVNEVALGNTKDYITHDTSLTVPPDGYNSAHGVGKKWDKLSQFENDEYVIYSVNQQRVRYLVEFTVKGDKIKPVEEIITDDSEKLSDLIEQTNIHDVSDILDPLSKVKPGLIGTGDKEVELKAVHIRAKLIDLAAQVVVLQEYYNSSTQAIEAKYVFPLDDAAAVCGFEAFINGKHIVGEVKEKETAHKEYKKAISEGHGAYLMDQDEETPDVFTVSVGNLPPGACVLIKITYMAELQVEEELISFRLPATVAPWKEDSALKLSTQNELESHKMTSSCTTVQVAVEMPFDIRSLHCPTHKIRIKQTASKAYVEMMDNQSFGSGFQILIGLAEIHVPHMWVERHPQNKEHQACMLTFYPEFETTEVTEGEVILILDTSNSMTGAALMQAKKVALLALKHIPATWQFNVVRFGSDYEELFPAPRATTEDNMQAAIQFVQNSVPSGGNTDVMRTLRPMFLLPSEGLPRNVFLISDGHINDDDLVLRSAHENSSHTRVFTFGVSETCNSYTLKALARVSGGAFEFFNNKTKSKWEPKVKGQMSKAHQPGLTSVSVKWQQYDENLPPPVQAPRQITALFNGSRQVIYGFVPNCTMATLIANVGGQEVSTVVYSSELSITEGQLVHRLTARAVIRDWEDGMLSGDRTNHEVAKMDLKNYIIDLSKEYSIVTQFTSFIAVEKREENEKDLPREGPTIKELVEKENVDILNYMGWTKLPEDDSLAILSSFEKLSEEVSENKLSNKMIHDLGGLEQKFLKLRDMKGIWDMDVLNATKALVQAFSLAGDTEKSLELAVNVFSDVLENAESMTETPSYAQMAAALADLRDRSNSLKQNTLRSSIPLPKFGDGTIYIQTLTGSPLTLSCQNTMTLSELKAKIQKETGTPVDQQRLVYKGRQLEDHQSLCDLKVGFGDTMHLVKRLRGGGPPPPEAYAVSSVYNLCDWQEEIEECKMASPSYYQRHRGDTRQDQQTLLTETSNICVDAEVIEEDGDVGLAANSPDFAYEEMKIGDDWDELQSFADFSLEARFVKSLPMFEPLEETFEDAEEESSDDDMGCGLFDDGYDYEFSPEPPLRGRRSRSRSREKSLEKQLTAAVDEMPRAMSESVEDKIGFEEEDYSSGDEFGLIDYADSSPSSSPTEKYKTRSRDKAWEKPLMAPFVSYYCKMAPPARVLQRDDGDAERKHGTRTKQTARMSTGRAASQYVRASLIQEEKVVGPQTDVKFLPHSAKGSTMPALRKKAMLAQGKMEKQAEVSMKISEEIPRKPRAYTRQTARMSTAAAIPIAMEKMSAPAAERTVNKHSYEEILPMFIDWAAPSQEARATLKDLGGKKQKKKVHGAAPELELQAAQLPPLPEPILHKSFEEESNAVIDESEGRGGGGLFGLSKMTSPPVGKALAGFDQTEATVQRNMQSYERRDSERGFVRGFVLGKGVMSGEKDLACAASYKAPPAPPPLSVGGSCGTQSGPLPPSFGVDFRAQSAPSPPLFGGAPGAQSVPPSLSFGGSFGAPPPPPPPSFGSLGAPPVTPSAQFGGSFDAPPAHSSAQFGGFGGPPVPSPAQFGGSFDALPAHSSAQFGGLGGPPVPSPAQFGGSFDAPPAPASQGVFGEPSSFSFGAPTGFPAPPQTLPGFGFGATNAFSAPPPDHRLRNRSSGVGFYSAPPPPPRNVSFGVSSASALSVPPPHPGSANFGVPSAPPPPPSCGFGSTLVPASQITTIGIPPELDKSKSVSAAASHQLKFTDDAGNLSKVLPVPVSHSRERKVEKMFRGHAEVVNDQCQKSEHFLMKSTRYCWQKTVEDLESFEEKSGELVRKNASFKQRALISSVDSNSKMPPSRGGRGGKGGKAIATLPFSSLVGYMPAHEQMSSESAPQRQRETSPETTLEKYSLRKRRSSTELWPLQGVDLNVEDSRVLDMTLSNLGIGSGITSIRARKGQLKLRDVDRLLEQQCGMGYWEFGPDLDEILGIDSDQCLNILQQSGLASLGLRAAEHIKLLVATILVIYSLVELLLPELLLLPFNASEGLINHSLDTEKLFNKVEGKLRNCSWSSRLREAFNKAIEFCESADRQHPVVCSTLELGHNWFHVASNLMQPITG